MGQDQEFNTACGIPDPCRFVRGSGDETITAGAERSRIDQTVMLEDFDLSAGVGVPDPRGGVVQGDSQHALSRRVECDALDRTTVSQYGYHGSGRSVPDPDGVISGGRGHAIS